MNKPAFDKILLAIDGSLAAKAAVGAVAHLAAPTGAQVVVLHVGN